MLTKRDCVNAPRRKQRSLWERKVTNSILAERTKFILFFYKTARQPFDEILRKIETKASPYEPYYNESGDPPYLEEYFEAKNGINCVGFTAISLLSESLEVYFNYLTRGDKIDREGYKKKGAFKGGILKGYKKIFAENYNIDWDNCPSDIDELEQVILARNDVRHPSQIFDFDLTHSSSTIKKYRKPIFEDPNRQAKTEVSFGNWIYVDESILSKVIDSFNVFSEWLETEMFKARHPDI